MTESVHGISKEALAALKVLAGPSGEVVVDEQANIAIITFANGNEMQMDIPDPTIN